IGDPGTAGQRAQSLAQRRSRVDLARHLRKLASDRKPLRLGLVANYFDRFQQAEPSLDAYHQKIENVGKLASDIDLTALGAFVEIVTRKERTHGGADNRQHDNVGSAHAKREARNET